jgi:hypothetical protein
MGLIFLFKQLNYHCQSTGSAMVTIKAIVQWLILAGKLRNTDPGNYLYW